MKYLNKIKKLKNLDIASDKFSILESSSHLKFLNHEKWKDYIDNSSIYTWYEDTEGGKHTLANINLIPEDFKSDVLSRFNHIMCFSDYNKRKGDYIVSITFSSKIKRIYISLERRITINDLKHFLDMANNMDALLLYDCGEKIIDKELIELLEENW